MTRPSGQQGTARAFAPESSRAEVSGQAGWCARLRRIQALGPAVMGGTRAPPQSASCLGPAPPTHTSGVPTSRDPSARCAATARSAAATRATFSPKRGEFLPSPEGHIVQQRAMTPATGPPYPSGCLQPLASGPGPEARPLYYSPPEPPPGYFCCRACGNVDRFRRPQPPTTFLRRSFRSVAFPDRGGRRYRCRF